MKKAIAVAAAVLVIGAGAIACGAGMGHKPAGHNQTYTEHYSVMLAGETLWQKCARYAGKEDILTLVERVRKDNGITDPGKLQPGQKILIRVKN